MSFLLDGREGSYRLANHEPVRSLLATCPACNGHGVGSGYDCNPCRATGRQLSRITTSSGDGGPDILICGNGPNGALLIAVEVKSLSDLFQSADTGRLQAHGTGQLPAMLADYDLSYLCWYGTIRCSDSGHLEEPAGRGDNGRTLWRPVSKNGPRPGNGDGETRRPLPCEYLDHLIMAVEAMGVHVIHQQNERAVARWLGSLYGYWSKPFAEHSFTRSYNPPPRLPQAISGVDHRVLERARRIEGRYTGLGPVTALAAASHFGSVREMANATEKEWRAVDGIGPVIGGALAKEFGS